MGLGFLVDPPIQLTDYPQQTCPKNFHLVGSRNAHLAQLIHRTYLQISGEPANSIRPIKIANCHPRQTFWRRTT